jgi:hypothetical protein
MADLIVIGRSSTTRETIYEKTFPIYVGSTFPVDLANLSRYGQVSLEVAVHFGPGIHVQAAVDTSQIQSLNVRQPNEKRVEVDVLHEEEERRQSVRVYMKPSGNKPDCALHCPATGKRSGGPCIDCSDGEYTIRLCC